ncbi:MAG: DMT family transporter [Anderseniella sp.]|nr:DMT family transporter [Anderseniella sp.]
MNAPSSTISPAGASVSGGLALMAGAMLLLPAMDIMGKAMSTELNGIQVSLARFAFQALYLLPLLLWLKGVAGLMPNRIWPNVVRALLMAGATTCFFTSLRWLPVPDAIAIFFVEPLILTILSALVLKEKVGWRRRVAVAVGFIGALIVIQPSYAIFGAASLLPIAAATLFAIYLLYTKALSASEDPMTMQFFSGLVSVPALALVSMAGTGAGLELFTLTWPSSQHWIMLAAVGLIATVGHLMVVHAFQRAPASVLAPFTYIEIVSATALSYLVFGEIPQGMKWLGIAIIVGAGLYVWWRERVAAA